MTGSSGLETFMQKEGIDFGQRLTVIPTVPLEDPRGLMRRIEGRQHYDIQGIVQHLGLAHILVPVIKAPSKSGFPLASPYASYHRLRLFGPYEVKLDGSISRIQFSAPPQIQSIHNFIVAEMALPDSGFHYDPPLAPQGKSRGGASKDIPIRTI